jgi:hypothetical protein
MGREPARDLLPEFFSVHGQRAASGHAREVRDLHHQRARATHLFFDQPDGVREVGAAQAVGAHELGEEVVMLRRRATRWFLLHQRDVHAELGDLIRALGPGEARSDNDDSVWHYFLDPA